MKATRFGFSLLALALATTGCGDDEHEHDHEHSLEEEGCEHLVEGPFEPITALADSAGTLPNAAIEHTSVQISLVPVTGGNGGFVAFEAEADGDYLFFLDTNVPARFLDSAGAVVPIEATEIGSELCTEIAVIYTVELEVGTYTIQLGPTAATTVSIVHEEASGEHTHE